jgi:hypothetical protein
VHAGEHSQLKAGAVNGGGVIQNSASDAIATIIVAARERRVRELLLAEGRKRVPAIKAPLAPLLCVWSLAIATSFAWTSNLRYVGDPRWRCYPEQCK